MKNGKLIFLFVILLCALFVMPLASAENAAQSDGIYMTVSDDFSTKCYTNGNDPDYLVGAVYAYNRSQENYGLPYTWSITGVNGEEVPIESFFETDGQLMLIIYNPPSEPTTLEYVVSYSCGTDFCSTTLQMEFVEHPYAVTPEPFLNVPAVIRAQEGQAFDFAVTTSLLADLDWLQADVPYAFNIMLPEDSVGAVGIVNQTAKDVTTITPQIAGCFPIVINFTCLNYELSTPSYLYVSDVNGNVPNVAGISAFSQLAHGIYAYEEDDAFSYFDTQLAQINLRDGVPAMLRELYGTDKVEWSLTSTGSAAMGQYELWDVEDHYAAIGLIEPPTQTGTVTLTVTGTIGQPGEQNYCTFSQDFDVEILPPSAMNFVIPEEMNAQLGQDNAYEITQSVVPDWNANFNIEHNGCIGGWGYGYDGVLETFYFSIDPITAGRFPIELSLSTNNLCITRETMLVVADENGNVPELGLNLMANQHFDFIYTGANENNTTDISFTADGLDALRAVTGTDYTPVWQFTAADGLVVTDSYAYENGYFITIRSSNLAVGTYTVDATCTYGTEGTDVYYTDTVTANIQVKENPFSAMDDLGLPDTMTLTLGETVTFDVSAYLPANADRDMSTGYSGSDYFEWVNSDTASVTLRAVKPGRFTFSYFLFYSNLTIQDSVIVSIADENGNVPELKLEIEKVTHTDFVFQDGLYSNAPIGRINITNMQTLKDMTNHGIDMQYEYTLSEGLNLYSFGSGWDFVEYDIATDGLVPGEYSLDVVCSFIAPEYGINLSETVHFPITVLPNPLTDNALGYPKSLDLQVGDIFTLDAMAPVGENWSHTEPKILFLNDDEGFATYAASSGSQYAFKVTTPGIWSFRYGWESSNLRVNETITLRVADENGNVPVPEMLLFGDTYYSTLFTTESANEAPCGLVSLQNLDALQASLGETVYPSWAVSSTNGLVVGDPNVMNEDDTYCGVYVNTNDSTPGDHTIYITCTVGDPESEIYFQETYSMPITIAAVPDVESAIAAVLPERMDLQLGGQFSVDTNNILPDAYSDIDVSLEFSTSYYCLDTVSNQNGVYTYAAGNSGIFRVTFYFHFANITVTKHVSLFIADENGNVPSAEVHLTQNEDIVALFTDSEEENSVFLNTIWLSNYYDLRDYFDGQLTPTWEISCSSEDIASKLYTLPFDDRVDVIIGPHLFAQEEDAEITITCKIGDEGTLISATESISFTLSIRDFFLDDLSDINVADRIDVTVGETFSLSRTGLLPDGWDAQIPSVWVMNQPDSIAEVESTDTEYIYFAQQTGVYRLDINWNLGNISWNDTAFVYIADLDGTIEEPQASLSVENLIDTVYAGGNYGTWLATVNFDNFDQLSQLTDDYSITWAYDVQGDAPLDLSFSENSNNHSLSMWLNEAPAAGDTAVTITGTLGEDGSLSFSATKTIAFKCVALDSPELNLAALPASITVNRGETFALDLNACLPQGATNQHMLLDIIENEWGSVEENSFENGVATLTACEESGVYLLTLYIRLANMDAEHDMLLYILNEDGSMPELTYEIISLHGDVDREFYTEGNYTLAFELFIQDYDAKASLLEGMPIFTVEQLTGDPLPLNGNMIVDSYDDIPWYYDISLVKQPETTGLRTYRVTATWDEVVSTLDLSINVLPCPVAGGLQGIDVYDVTLKVGDELRISDVFPLLPEGFGDHFTDADQYVGFSGSFFDLFEHVRREDDTDVYKAVTPGVASYSLFYSVANFYCWKDIYVTVTDENGNLPYPELIIEPYTESGLFDGGNSTFLGGAYVNEPDFNAFAAIAKGEPVWTITKHQGPTDIIFDFGSDVGNYLNLFFAESPKEGDYSITISLTWDEQVFSETIDFVVHPALPQIPTGLNLPSSMTVDIGEIIELARDFSVFLPEGYAIEDSPAISSSLWGDFSQDFHLEQLESNDACTLYTFTRSGVFNCTWYAQIGNYQFLQPVTVIVRDMNGNLPVSDPELQLFGTADYYYLGGQNQWLAGVEIPLDQYNKFKEYFGGEPSFELVSCSLPAYTSSPSNNQLLVSISEAPAEVGEITFSVKMTWAHATFIYDGIIPVIECPAGVPEGLALQSEMDVTVGDTLTIHPLDAVLPAGWTPGEGDFPFLSAWASPESTGSFTATTNADNSLSLLFTEPGIIQVAWSFSCNSFIINQRSTIIVRNEDGSFPYPDLDINIMAEEFFFEGGNDLYFATADLNMDDYNAFAALTDETPVWSVQSNSGDAQFECNFWPGDEYYCDIYFEDVPAAGEYGFTVTLSWAGKTFSKDVAFTVQPAPSPMPEELRLPDTLTVDIGETVTVYHDTVFLPEDTSFDHLPTLFATIREDYGQDEHMNFLGFSEDAFSFEFTRSGIFNCHWHAKIGNYSYTKAVTVFVLDENGNIPSLEVKLERQSLNDHLYVGGENLWIATVGINYQEFLAYQEMYGGKPSFELSSSLPCTLWQFQDECVALILDQIPTEPGVFEYSVRMTWGQATDIYSGTIDLIECPAGTPQGIDLPEEMTVTVGDEEVFHCLDHILPDGWITDREDDFPSLDLFTYEDVSVGAIEGWYVDEGTGYKVRYTEPGVVLARWDFSCNSFILSKTVVIYIQDENGQVPMGDNDFDLIRSSDVYYIGGSNNSIGSTMINEVWAHNMSRFFGLTPQWTLTQLAGEPVVLKTYDDTFSGFLAFENTPTVPGVTSFRLSLTWGPLTLSKDFTVEVKALPGQAPNGLQLAPCHFMEPGEVYTIRFEDIISPSGWSLPGATADIHITGSNIDEFEVITEGVEPNAFAFRVNEPGAYPITVVVNYQNFSFYGSQTVVVGQEPFDIGVTSSALRLVPGMSSALYLTGDIDRLTDVTFENRNPDLFTLTDNGTVTGLSEGRGEVRIKASVEDISFTIKVPVEVIPAGTAMALPAKLTVIEDEAFLGTPFQHVIVPDGVLELGSRVFASSSLQFVTIPGTVGHIGEDILADSDAVILCHFETDAHTYAMENNLPYQIIP